MDVRGQGFRPGTKVKIVFDSPRHVVVGSAVASPEGGFDTSVVVPRARPGNHDFEVVGTSASGTPAHLASPVTVLISVRSRPAGKGFAERGLLTIAVGLPIATWLVLEVLSWRRRRPGQASERS